MYLNMLNSVGEASPLLSFRLVMNFNTSKCIKVPVYLGEGDQEVVILPKNGLLPKNHWVKFKVKSGGGCQSLIRVFA